MIAVTLVLALGSSAQLGLDLSEGEGLPPPPPPATASLSEVEERLAQQLIDTRERREAWLEWRRNNPEPELELYYESITDDADAEAGSATVEP